MNREFEYEPEATCDSCGCKGAFDIYGDFICSDCLDSNDDTVVEIDIVDDDDNID